MQAAGICIPAAIPKGFGFVPIHAGHNDMVVNTLAPPIFPAELDHIGVFQFGKAILPAILPHPAKVIPNIAARLLFVRNKAV